MSKKNKHKKEPGKKSLRRPMYEISCVEIGRKLLKDIVFASNEQLALREAYRRWPTGDKPPFRVDWKAKFVGMGEDHSIQGVPNVGDAGSGTEQGVERTKSKGVSEKTQTA